MEALVGLDPAARFAAGTARGFPEQLLLSAELGQAFDRPEERRALEKPALANKLVELEVVETVSEDTVLRVLKKATSSRGRRSRGASRRG